MPIEMYTYKDAHDHLVDVFDIDTTGRENRLAKRAILETYRELPGRHKWKYYERRFSVRTEASQNTGTVAYTHSTRTVTLTGATFPSNVHLYRIYLASNQSHYPIESRTDDNNVVLTITENPGADVASGTSYILYRSSYPFPSNFRKIDTAWDVVGDYPINYVDPDEMLGHAILHHTPSTPVLFTINADGNYYGALSMTFSPPPSEARTYDFNYQAAPRPLRVFSYTTGSVTHTATSETVNGTGTAWTAADHEGTVIRFGDATNIPTNREGDYPYLAYRIVSDVASSSQLTLDQAPAITGTTVKYELSDPLDITTDSMMTYFLRACEAQFAVLTNRKDKQERLGVAELQLREAAGADGRNRRSSTSGFPGPFHMRGWSTVPDEIVNPSPGTF